MEGPERQPERRKDDYTHDVCALCVLVLLTSLLWTHKATWDQIGGYYGMLAGFIARGFTPRDRGNKPE